jgi:hypothetical protein
MEWDATQASCNWRSKLLYIFNFNIKQSVELEDFFLFIHWEYMNEWMDEWMTYSISNSILCMNAQFLSFRQVISQSHKLMSGAKRAHIFDLNYLKRLITQIAVWIIISKKHQSDTKIPKILKRSKFRSAILIEFILLIGDFLDILA